MWEHVRDLKLLYVAKLVRTTSYSGVAIVLASYLVLKGLSTLQVGVVFSAATAGGLAVTLALPTILGALGFSRAVRLLPLLIVFSGLLLLLAHNFLLFLVASFTGLISVTQTESGVFQALDQVIASEYAGEKRVTAALSVYNATGYAGSAVGAGLVSLAGFLLPEASAQMAVLLFYCATGLAVLVLYSFFDVGRLTAALEKPTGVFRTLSHEKRLITLTGLFGVDAFAGSLVAPSWLSYWFQTTFKIGVGEVGLIFFAASTVSSLSLLTAPLIAKRIGLVKTMVYSHLPSNVILLAIPFSGSLALATALYWLRQTLSQMDVPTRQALVMLIVSKEKKAAAASATTSVRSISQIAGSPVTGSLFELSFPALAFVAGGLIKIAYDISLLYHMRGILDVGRDSPRSESERLQDPFEKRSI
ncbi:MAG: hypothetical protein QXI37_00415 [Thermoprotei archaeon]